MSGNIVLAGERVVARYYRRFPHVHWSKWDINLVRELKWYPNLKRLVAARTRFGKD